MGCRVGIDIGGTFTDFVLTDDATGDCYIHKQLTTPRDPSESILTGVPVLLDKARKDVSEVSSIVHGTTLVSNTLIERQGAVCGMLCTKGFSTILDIGYENRYDQYDFRAEYATPVVPLTLRREIEESISCDGTVIGGVDESAVKREVNELIEKHKITSLAICLINSYINPEHEEKIRAICKEIAPDLYVTISSETFPFMKEYDRWTTATVNAYVQPLIDTYLKKLEAGFETIGFQNSFYMMTSSGGVITRDLARQFPVRLLESGPAACVLMSSVLGRQLKRDSVLSFDMGGTTAKGAIVKDGQPLQRYDLEIDHAFKGKEGSGLVVKTPSVDLIEIGTGGGSIAEMDSRGVIQVGPRSAGAEPGPVCYQLGGDQITVTDANLILGYLDDDSFLGGKMKLSKASSEDVMEKGLAKDLDVSVIRAAWGIHETVNEEIARAFRTHAAERGFDYRHCCMVPSGGAGPASAMRVARKLRIPKVIFSAGAGAMSAFGLLTSPLAYALSQSDFIGLNDLSIDEFEEKFTLLIEKAKTFLFGKNAGKVDFTTNLILDMRYRGQGYSVEVDLPYSGDLKPLYNQLHTLFESAYENIFSTTFQEKAVDIETWKVEVRGTPPSTDNLHLAEKSDQSSNALKGSRPAYFPELDEALVDCKVYDRYALKAGDKLTGPALVEEAETTYVIGVGDMAEVDISGALIVNTNFSDGV